jgi:hypothetical protein
MVFLASATCDEEGKCMPFLMARISDIMLTAISGGVLLPM